MRIGIDVRLWNQTGVGRYIRNLVTELSNQDTKNEYVLFCLSEDAEGIKKNLQLSSKNSWKLVIADITWHSLQEQLRFPRILYKEHLDLMHFPYFSVPVFYRKPFVVTIHDLIINQISTGKASTKPLPIYKMKRFGYSLVLLSALKKAQKIIVPTKSVKAELLAQTTLSTDKVVVTYEGAPEWSQAQKTTSKKESNKPYFLYVGNAYPHKNLERLLSAFALFLKNHSETELILVGKKDYFYKRLEQFSLQKNIQNSVIFEGEVTDTRLQELYSGAQALVMPSLLEGFGLTALEAMSSRCVVVASDIPVFHEVCEEAAIYFDPKNESDIAEKLSDVMTLSVKQKESYIKSGLERVQLFSWKKMARQTQAVYESCNRI